MSPSGIGTAVRDGGSTPAVPTPDDEEERARSEADGIGGTGGTGDEDDAAGTRGTDDTGCLGHLRGAGGTEGTGNKADAEDTGGPGIGGHPLHGRRRKHHGFPAAWTGIYSHRFGYFINPAHGPQTRTPTKLTRNNYSKD
ncbi:hypothetical protein Misp03_43940 [Microbispora sp. NBRC 16548]|nr:hypothetical protein Misp03_43940 [Microbispora sp. NBRC 16548]